MDISDRPNNCTIIDNSTINSYIHDKSMKPFLKGMNEYFELTPTNEEDCIISTTQLKGRAVVLSSGDVSLMSYAVYDPLVFSSSKVWEQIVDKKQNRSNGKVESDNRTNNRKRNSYIAESQDY
jgi:hypothetical protein